MRVGSQVGIAIGGYQEGPAAILASLASTALDMIPHVIGIDTLVVPATPRAASGA
jgi:hypothetical protein